MFYTICLPVRLTIGLTTIVVYTKYDDNIQIYTAMAYGIIYTIRALQISFAYMFTTAMVWWPVAPHIILIILSAAFYFISVPVSYVPIYIAGTFVLFDTVFGFVSLIFNKNAFRNIKYNNLSSPV